MSIFLNSNSYGIYTHITNMDKGKAIISKADNDNNGPIYYKSVFDQLGNFYYNRVMITSQTPINSVYYLESIALIE